MLNLQMFITMALIAGGGGGGRLGCRLSSFALLLIVCMSTTSVVAENCGDPLASCYVGNAQAGEHKICRISQTPHTQP
jgi:hypothetical protein